MTGLGRTTSIGWQREKSQQMKNKALVGIALVFVACVFVYRPWSGHDVGLSSNATTMRTPRATEAAGILQTVRASPWRKRLQASIDHQNIFIDPARLPDENVKAIESSPERDSPEAQLALATIYEQCAHHVQTDAEIEERAAKTSMFRDSARVAAGETVDGKSVSFAVAQATIMKTIRDRCAPFPSDKVAQGRVKLESLARAGDPEAQEAFLSAIWADSLYFAQGGVDQKDADSLRDLELARQVVWDSLSRGDCNNHVLNSLWRFKLGPVSNYIGWSILGQQGLAALDRQGRPQAEVDRERSYMLAEFDRLRTLVPADEIDDTNQTIAYLQQVNCRE